MAVNFVGLDPSLTSFGVAVFCHPSREFRTFSFGTSRKESVFDRQKEALSKVLPLLSPNDVVAMESLGVGARFVPSGLFVERVELAGMLKLSVPLRTRMPILLAHPKHVKLLVAGKATASKEEMVQAVAATWGLSPKNHDEADALGLALLAYFGLMFPMRPPELMTEVGLVRLDKKRLDAVRGFQKANADVIRRMSHVVRSLSRASACSSREPMLVSS